MDVILTKDVKNLGRAGELVKVKPGYGRNYLLPRGFAMTATSRNVAELEHNKRIISARAEKLRGELQTIASRLNGMTLQFERLVGEDEKLFGSVTKRDIADQLARAKLEVDPRKIDLPEPIKALGKYEVPIELGGDVVAALKFWVVSKAKD